MTRHYRFVGVVAPLVVAAATSLLRDRVANTSAALVLVLVVLAVAVRGDRWAGLLAALTAAAAFDFVLTAPYYDFAIHSARDVETAVLLLLVGAAVSEVAQWGRRELARAVRQEGHVDGLVRAARMAAEGVGTAEAAAVVAAMIADVLDLDDCRFATEPSDPQRPRLDPDGTVTWRGRPVDVDRHGLPTMDLVELEAPRAGGRFLLSSATAVRKPSAALLRIAVSLAAQVGPSTGDRGLAPVKDASKSP